MKTISAPSSRVLLREQPLVQIHGEDGERDRERADVVVDPPDASLSASASGLSACAAAKVYTVMKSIPATASAMERFSLNVPPPSLPLSRRPAVRTARARA